MSNELPQTKEALPGPAEAGSPADQLARAQKQLEKLNLLFDVAINNMARGLSVFDADRRLIVCNKRYAETYDLPESLTRPGTPLAEIARHLARDAAGHDDSGEGERQSSWIEPDMSRLARGETRFQTQHLKDGQSVQITRLPLTDGGWVEIHERVGERRKGGQSIKWLAHNDPLTEVANPLYFGEELENALRQLKLGVAFALHWIDLDRFAEINETFGHSVGDALLKGVAQRLVKSVRKQDLVARLGGDEFAVIQAGIKTQAEAERLTKRMLLAVKEPFDILGHKISISASIGVVLAPEHGRSSLALMKNVYVALYAAKAAGRATHAVFEEGRHDAPNERHGVGPDQTSAPAER